MTQYRGGTAKSLSGKRINDIVNIINNWSEPKLTWDALVWAIQIHLMVKITRQTLNSYLQIKAAFVEKKEALRLQKLGYETNDSTKNSQRVCVSCIKLKQQVDKLKNKVVQLEKTNESQLGQIVSMIHHIHRHYPNVDLDEIMKPIEEVYTN
ncbi:hypothetical protein EYS14_11275 [Alteromonadaceae bacterium M269]|nr:hypothetical protein EYS14_11275 [Alteromonadaceae bacterium M269]